MTKQLMFITFFITELFHFLVCSGSQETRIPNLPDLLVGVIDLKIGFVWEGIGNCYLFGDGKFKCNRKNEPMELALAENPINGKK